MRRNPVQRKRKAFTLLEILAVIGILALLLGVIVRNVDSSFSSGQEKTAEIFVKSSLDAPLLSYRMDIGSYPSTEEGLAALMKAPESAGSRWKGPYIKYTPIDPWKMPYQYMYPGKHNPDSYDLWSLGPDKVESNDDIGNWEK